jgi:hypothetical protein
MANVPGPRSADPSKVPKSASKHDRKTEWRPDNPVGYAPLFVPSQWSLGNFAQYFLGYPGFFWPWNTIYFGVCCFTYMYATPPLSMCKEFAAEWIAPLYLRNLVLLWIFAGGWHLLLCACAFTPPEPARATVCDAYTCLLLRRYQAGAAKGFGWKRRHGSEIRQEMAW